MKTTIFLIACIVLSANAGHLTKIFKEVADTEYGKTLIASVELQMESGEQVDDVIDSMAGVVGGLKGQLADATSLSDRKRAACQDDRTELSRGLSQAQNDAYKHETASAFDATTLASRQAELANKQRELGDRRDMLATLTAQREGEIERYAATKDEYDQVFSVIEDCRAIMSSRLVAGSFLETKTGIQTALLDRLTRFKTPAQGVAHGYGAFIRLLAKILAKSKDVQADQAIVQQLFDVLDRVEDNLSIAQATERDADRTRAADFEELSAKLDGLIRGCLSSILDLNSTINTLGDRVRMAADKMAVALATQNDFQVRLDDRNAECKAEANVWEVFYNNMSAELSTAGKIMYLLEDKRALLARYGL